MTPVQVLCTVPVLFYEPAVRVAHLSRLLNVDMP